MDRALRALIVKVLLGILVVEATITWVFELIGRHHETDKWIAGLVGTCLYFVIKAPITLQKIKDQQDCDKKKNS